MSTLARRSNPGLDWNMLLLLALAVVVYRTLTKRTPGITIAPGVTVPPEAENALAAAGEVTQQAGITNLVLQAVQSRQWPDSCLGCPQPGASCAQVATMGWEFQLVVSPQGATMPGLAVDVHTDWSGSRAVICSPA